MQSDVEMITIKVKMGDKVVEKCVEKWALDIFKMERLHAQLRQTKDPVRREKIIKAINLMVEEDGDFD